MPDLDSYPTLTELVTGMKGYSYTDQWDVVVSYSVGKLNALLSDVWKNDSKVTANFTFTTTNHGFKGKVYYTNWDLTLQSPTLEFTQDKQAKLSMPMSGTTQDYDDDETDTKKDIPTGYVVQVVTPLMAMSVSEGETKSQADMGTVISFGDADAKIHIVFNFAVKGWDSATCKVVWTGSGDAPTETSDAVAKIQEHLQNSVNAITYSLAVATPTEAAGTVYLTPESMVFTLLSPTTASSSVTGCLSVYIKTKNSNNAKGHPRPEFYIRSPGSTDTIATYPIPSGHTASIIIRHKLVWEQFLKPCFESIADSNNEHAFTSVDLTTLAPDAGFTLKLMLNRVYIVDSMQSDVSPSSNNSWRLNLTNLTFDDSPVTLTIDNSSMKWQMSFPNDKEFKWEHDYKNQWGDDLTEYGFIEYKASLDYNGSLLSTDQAEVNEVVSIGSGDWSHSSYAKKPGWTDLYSADYPGIIKAAIDSLVYPGFSKSMRLDYLATTNIFAPNQHIINIDTGTGVMTPHDILIVGDVVSSSSSGSSSSVSTSQGASTHYNPGA